MRPRSFRSTQGVYAITTSTGSRCTAALIRSITTLARFTSRPPPGPQGPGLLGATRATPRPASCSSRARSSTEVPFERTFDRGARLEAELSASSGESSISGSGRWNWSSRHTFHRRRPRRGPVRDQRRPPFPPARFLGAVASGTSTSEARSGRDARSPIRRVDSAVAALGELERRHRRHAARPSTPNRSASFAIQASSSGHGGIRRGEGAGACPRGSCTSPRARGSWCRAGRDPPAARAESGTSRSRAPSRRARPWLGRRGSRRPCLRRRSAARSARIGLVPVRGGGPRVGDAAPVRGLGKLEGSAAGLVREAELAASAGDGRAAMAAGPRPDQDRALGLPEPLAELGPRGRRRRRRRQHRSESRRSRRPRAGQPSARGRRSERARPPGSSPRTTISSASRIAESGSAERIERAGSLLGHDRAVAPSPRGGACRARRPARSSPSRRAR